MKPERKLMCGVGGFFGLFWLWWLLCAVLGLAGSGLVLYILYRVAVLLS